MDNPPEQHTGHPRRWQILSVLLVSLLVVVLDNTVLNVALKTIQEELEATQNEIVWAINSYTLVFAALLFTWGVLGDRYGRKKILVIGLVLFGLASALSAFATDPMQLIIARGLMGIGGASVLPVTLAIITVVFPPHERGKAIGLWAASVGGAVALGPLLGGFLLEHFWWGSVFLINVPIVAIGVIGILLLVPESSNPNPGRLDPLGLLMSITGLLLLVYGIQHGGDSQDWLSLGVSGAIIGGLAILILFLWLEIRSDHPSLDISLFGIRSFSASLTTVSLTFAAMTGSLLFLAFYMQLVRGYSPLQAGAFTLPVAVGQLLAAPRSAKMVERFGARKVIGFGLVLAGSVFASFVFLQPDTPAWILLVTWFFLGFGLGNVIAPATTRMTLAVPPEKAGAGSAVQNTVRQVAAALGVAVLSSVVAIAYTNTIRDAPGITELPQALQGPVTDSIGGAYEVTGRAVAAGALDPQQAASIQAESVEAFMRAFHLSSLGAALLILIAFVALLMRLPAQAEHAAWGGHAGHAEVDSHLSPDAFEGEQEDLVADAEPTPVPPVAGPKP
ncbi:MAG: MFS transporter [Candidatus Nanopelagicales bacterium]|jgi:EmrB/QacA subfamily drug resistance transporter